MKRIAIVLVLFFSVIMLFNACENYVTDIDPLIDAVEDARLNDQSQLNFVIKGVKTQYSEVIDALSCLSGDLSDELIYDSNLKGASFPSFQEIDLGEIQLDNTSVQGLYNNLGEMRFFADDLVRRTNSITVDDDALKNSALFTGKFFGGMARFFYAAYFGLNPDQGGGIINDGPFIASADMYDLAIEKFKEALTYATDYDLRLTNTLIARAYLYKGDYNSASTYADAGLVNGDAPFQSLHSVDADNYWWGYAGAGRVQLGVDFRFHDYIVANPLEANRIKIVETTALDTTTIPVYYRQDMYPGQSSPINTATWQENNLMRAELNLRSAGSGDALGLVNEVRGSHGLADLAAVDLDVIYTERDKELFTTGARLVDERRFNKWHLPAGAWMYLPITQDERNNNPNID